MDRMEKKTEEYQKFIEEELEKGNLTDDEDCEDELDENQPGAESTPDEGDSEDYGLGSLGHLKEGEEWKAQSEEYPLERGSLDNFDLYNRGYEFGLSAIKWGQSLDDEYQTEGVKKFVSNALMISAKLAGGYSFGFAQDAIGGNIANTKKAIRAGNKALKALEDSLKEETFISREEYQHFHQTLFELRNDIGVYIQDMRDKFNRGLDG